MHTIIHIGAGEGSCLAEWLQGDARHIVLVEPNPVLAERLRQAASGHSHVNVVEAAVAAEPGPCELFEYNLPQASGLHEPTALKRLFPGLRLLQSHAVTAISPQQLMTEHGPAEDDAQAQLFLHAPGEEHAILQMLMEDDQLSRVAELSISASAAPCHSAVPPIEQTLQALKDYGFALLEHEASDPDWQCWTLHLNPLKRRLVNQQRAYDEHLLQAQERHDKDAEALSRLDRQLRLAKEAHSSAMQVATLEQQRAQQQIDSLTQGLRQRDERLDALCSERTTLAARIEELEQHRETLEQQQGEWQQQQKQGRREQAAAKKAVKAAQVELEETRQTLRDKDATINRLSEQLAAQQRDGVAAEDRLAMLQETLERLFSEQQHYIQQTTNALGQHITRQARKHDAL